MIKSADMLNRIVATIEAYRATDPNLLSWSPPTTRPAG